MIAMVDSASAIVPSIIGALAALGVGWLGYRGVKRTSAVSSEASSSDRQHQAQQAALEAWQELLEPYRQEVRQLREDLGRERREREDTERQLHRKVDDQAKQIEGLRADAYHWRKVARVIAKWATNLRDEVLRLGGTVDATPEELLTLQAVDESLGRST